jgi:hypothetical protein
MKDVACMCKCTLAKYCYASDSIHSTDSLAGSRHLLVLAVLLSYLAGNQRHLLITVAAFDCRYGVKQSVWQVTSNAKGNKS